MSDSKLCGIERGAIFESAKTPECLRVYPFANGDLLRNNAPYLKRGSSGRGRRIAHMDCGRAIDNQEVVHQPSVRTQGLRSNTRLTRNKVIFADLWDQFLQAAHKRFLTEGSMHFFKSRSRVFSHETPKSGVGHGFREIPHVK